ncbi:MAG: prolipoprotein diacylglyceryl transferase [Clostridiales bacterium]|nr:prolipoprotein diacylglyceryl transferase [Clostridiales bacterium]
MIEFPGLWGLTLNIDRVAFEVFGISVYWYGIIIAAGFLLAVLLAMKASTSFGLNPDLIIDLVLFAAPVAIVAARIYYVVFKWSEFKDNLIDVFNTRKGGLAIYGAIIAALIVAWFFAKARKVKPLHLFDFCIPYLALAQSIGRWGNFINQEAFGTNTALPWGMKGDVIGRELASQMENLSKLGISVDPTLPVHPTFLYESLWNVLVFVILIWLRKRKKIDGEVFASYMILYGIGRFFIEGLRTDSLMLGDFRISQVLAFAFVIAFSGWLFVMRKKAKKLIFERESEGVESSYKAVIERLAAEDSSSAFDVTLAEKSVTIEDAIEDTIDETIEDTIDEDEAFATEETHATEGTSSDVEVSEKDMKE